MTNLTDSSFGKEGIRTIGNRWIRRTLSVEGGRLRTISIEHSSGEKYLEQTNDEFRLRLTKGETRTALRSDDFRPVAILPREDGCGVEAVLETDFDGGKVKVSVLYEAEQDENFIRKRVRVHPGGPEGWQVVETILEDIRVPRTIDGVIPYPRYPEAYPSGEDKVHGQPDKVRTDNASERFRYGDHSRSVVTNSKRDAGLFFFVEGLLGIETFNKPQGLLMGQKEYAALSDGLTSAAATIGAYCGPAEIGFKRYCEHLMNHYCVVRDKELPVSWSTWLVTQEGNKPLYGNYDRELLLDYLELIREAGFYDILHLDLGWEAEMPMAVDRVKFPNGIEEIVGRARDYGLEMTYWVNPFSSMYWRSCIEEEHPEWLVPGELSGKCKAHAICHLTAYYDYARERFVELVTRLGARVIYWDGLDWNIPECTSDAHGHRCQEELEVGATRRLAEMCRAVHRARPDALFVVFSLPFDNHRLSVVDQEQVSDTYSFPTIQSELIQRQQLYQATWEHPYKAIWGSWYGINWHNAGPDNLKRPLEELIHAEMSMIGNGIAQAGGGFDLKQAPRELIEFLRRLFAFRKRFAEYFDVYQHILGFPDGEHVDGEAHIIGGRGFIVLVNPTRERQVVNLPLGEVELELSWEQEYTISDWSNLEQGLPLGRTGIDSEFPIELGPLEVKYIGIDI